MGDGSTATHSSDAPDVEQSPASLLEKPQLPKKPLKPGVRKGSFGQYHVDCVPEYANGAGAAAKRGRVAGRDVLGLVETGRGTARHFVSAADGDEGGAGEGGADGDEGYE